MRRENHLNSKKNTIFLVIEKHKKCIKNISLKVLKNKKSDLKMTILKICEKGKKELLLKLSSQFIPSVFSFPFYPQIDKFTKKRGFMSKFNEKYKKIKIDVRAKRINRHFDRKFNLNREKEEITLENSNC